ncbi:hypothetical protein MIR68_005825 [Amoeboaphelidium protococcarum]|nr:hypothetical protein MIR68_005825 [Amoeboaphelidium protococcarum]
MLTKKNWVDLGLLVVGQVVLWYGLKYALKELDPMRKKKDQSVLKSKSILQRLGLKSSASNDLNEYEQIIATEIVHPDDLNVRFCDIGGIEHLIEDIKETVLYPLVLCQQLQNNSQSIDVQQSTDDSNNVRKQQNSSLNNLISPPKGVLFYGEPGNGKTMLAKALSKESNATFINIHVSTLTEKWFGESQKLVHALFSLAKKLQPSIIFIDEIDAFLRERSQSDHEVTGMMKAEFMSLWDGLLNDSQDAIIILGATNRAQDIDKAFLRRMPKRYLVPMPDRSARLKILDVILKGVPIADRDATLQYVADNTQDCSGSDLKELCREVALIPMRQMLKKNQGCTGGVQLGNEAVRQLTLQDFKQCLSKSGLQSEDID